MGEGHLEGSRQLTVSLYKPWVVDYTDPTQLRLVQLECKVRKLKVERPPTDQEQQKVNGVGAVGDGEDPADEKLLVNEEEDMNYLRSLDPKEWKKQDHYKVLGLENLRWKATESDIKKCYRRKVLRHHPDKRKAQGEEVREDDDYFTCITKAWETLGDKLKRRSYDSVDPHFDDNVPSNNEYNKAHFYKVFGEVFETNAQWSEKTPVPKLGNAKSTREQVDRFYTFWYNFESWREYSYLDEEEKEKGQDREERKWIEKQNKAVRAKRKKEEMVRIRGLVDLAYSIDPRIAKFKQEDKDKKVAAKKAKQDAARARQEEEERVQREAEDKVRAAKEKEEAKEKARQSALKAEREAQKRAIKKERKSLRDICKKNDYFSCNEEERLKHMTSMEMLCEALDAVQLGELTSELQSLGREAFLKSVEQTEKRIESERNQHLESNNVKVNSSSTVGSVSAAKKNTEWPADELQMLIKAVNMFPAGTNQRWEVVANFLNQHCSNGTSVVRTAKEVLAKAKELKGGDFSKSQLKDQANQKAYDNFEKEKKATVAPVVEVAAVSERFESVAEQQGLAKAWTNEEQQLLEQALKTYGASTPERWDRIAECVQTRTKKECMKRYKELVEMVNQYRATQASVTAKAK
ncbi:hypothetical protein LSTR_LSTR005241 [Laodelphax striatellus]|uniref:DnaJ homolog subfamily C member 2 n=2 Tax=Laodelphax striatellus TaxID=195883 RepID=A0A482XC06_LAOST|nr:hypothetical protein LSTR_LSTR005241 [Laodelphax striatellus]